MIISKMAALTAKGISLSILVSPAEDGKVELAILPKVEGFTGVQLVGRVFVGAPEELDAELSDLLDVYAAANGSLHEQKATFVAAKEAAEAAVREEAAKAAAAKTAAKATNLSAPKAGKSSAQKAKPLPELMSADQADEDDGDGEDDEVPAPKAAKASAKAEDADSFAFTL